jgi:hypothetical protein
MPQDRVSQVEKRRPPFGSCVDDRENGLQIAVEVYHWPCIAVEYEELVSVVPPAMCRTARECHGRSHACGESTPIAHTRHRAGPNLPFLVLRDVNMERRPFTVRGQGPLQL